MAPHASSTEQYECLRCDTIQAEPKTPKRFNRGPIRCRGCGGTVYLVDGKPASIKPAEIKTRVCKTCGAKLRASNSRQQCSACWGVR